MFTNNRLFARICGHSQAREPLDAPAQQPQVVDGLRFGEGLPGLPEDRLAPSLGCVQQHPDEGAAVGHVDAGPLPSFPAKAVARPGGGV